MKKKSKGTNTLFWVVVLLVAAFLAGLFAGASLTWFIIGAVYSFVAVLGFALIGWKW